MKKGKSFKEYQYLEQWRKIQRANDRLKKVFSSEKEKDQVALSNPEIKDHCRDLFQDIYHFKDWLLNDEDVSEQKKSKVETFINSNRYLRICADVCNQSKHKKLTKRRSKNEKFENILIHTKIDLNPLTGFSGDYEATIKIGEMQVNVLYFALESIKAWRKFLKINHLTY